MSRTAGAEYNPPLKWRSVITNQDWASIVSNLCIIIALIIFGSLQNPNTRPYLLYDATISYPYNPDSTIPYWAAVFTPLASLIVSLLVLEFGIAKRLNVSKISAVTSMLHFILDFIFTFATNALLTETCKLLVGRFRPDWLSRCNPTNTGNAVLERVSLLVMLVLLSLLVSMCLGMSYGLYFIGLAESTQDQTQESHFSSEL